MADKGLQIAKWFCNRVLRISGTPCAFLPLQNLPPRSPFLLSSAVVEGLRLQSVLHNFYHFVLRKRKVQRARRDFPCEILCLCCSRRKRVSHDRCQNSETRSASARPCHASTSSNNVLLNSGSRSSVFIEQCVFLLFIKGRNHAV